MAQERLSKASVALPATLVALVCAIAGFFVGRAHALRKIDDIELLIEEIEKTSTLGQIAAERRAGMALCYDDPARAESEMDDYSWAVPNIPTPFVGVAPAPGLHGNAVIDDLQFRHGRPIELPKPAGTYRIFVTGGSTAYGTGAPREDATIPAFLQALLERELAPRTGLVYEVINAANGAWASTHERILIENRLSEMEPDLVISFSGNNDVHWGFLGMNVLWFRNYAETHFGNVVRLAYELAGRTLPVPKKPPQMQSLPPADVLARLEKNLRLAVAGLEPLGATYVFALQPTMAASAKTLTDRERKYLEEEKGLGRGSTRYFAECYAVYRAELPKLELPRFRFVDLAGVFDHLSSDTDIFVDSYHFGDKGNRLIAERLFAELRPLLEP